MNDGKKCQQSIFDVYKVLSINSKKNYCINTEIKICKDDKMRQETLMRAPPLAPPHDGLFEYV